MSEKDIKKKDSKKTMKEKAIHETIDWAKAFIYAAIAVIIIRLYAFDTMMVPTGSMIPSIIPGDRLFVERITFQAIEPDYGDIVVFWTPFIDKEAQKMLGAFDKFMDSFSPAEFNGHVKYVKRLVGKPGDVLEMVPTLNNRYKILVNGKTPERLDNIYYDRAGIFDDVNFFYKMAYPNASGFIPSAQKKFFEFYNDSLDYSNAYKKMIGDTSVEVYAKKNEQTGRIQVIIPDNMYFVLGDNSPESLDSRFWGFVPKKNILGSPLLRFWPINRFGPANK